MRKRLFKLQRKFMIKFAKMACKNSQEIVDLTDELVRILKLENEQWFLDWQDEINRVSVK